MSNEELQKQLRTLISKNPEVIEGIKKDSINPIKNSVQEEKGGLENEKNKITSKKIEEIKKDLTEKSSKKINDAEKIKLDEQENTLLVNKLKSIGSKEEDFNEIPEWNKLSYGEKLLAIEQISQDTLSRVKEIGEQKFQEKNKISLSPKDFNLLRFGKKIWKNIGKSYWISGEEKNALKDFETGNLKPNSEIVKQIVEKTADMNLDVIEKNGKSFIEFIKIDKSLPEEQQKIIEEYNKVANEYAKMPDSWRNKKAANSKDRNIFKNKNYENYNKTKTLYDNASANLLNTKKEQYLKSGLNEKEAGIQAMLDMSEKDFQISTLQFLNTNPDAVQELKNIREKSSWGRLINNENIWRGLYMGTGALAKSVTVSTLGLIAAPLVSGAIGGARARRKAGQKIDTAFMEGRTAETFLERKRADKKGLFSDKNENRGLISKTLSGKDINAKEIGAFIDADSQIQRLDNLIQKLEEAKTDEEKLLIKDQLNARIGYIENKRAEGLINYGTKNALGTNYELFKKLSYAQMQVGLIDILNEKRETLLGLIMAENETKFNKEQANYKNQEMIRGAIVAGGFSILGSQIRGLLNGTEGTVNTNELKGLYKHNQENFLNDHQTNPTGINRNHENITVENQHNIPQQISFKPVQVEISSDGAIQTIADLKEQINQDYPDISKAPANIQEFMKTDNTQEAIKLGFYNPDSPAESAMGLKGSTLGFDENGKLISHDIKTGQDSILIDEKGSVEKYSGQMADTHQNTTQVNQNDSFTNVKQVKLETGEPIENINETPMQTSLTSNESIENANQIPTQVKLETGEPITNTQEIISTGSNPYKLTQEQLSEATKTYDANIKKIFPGHPENWNSIKSNTGDNSPTKIFERWDLKNTEKIPPKPEEIPPLVSHLNTLRRETGLKPFEGIKNIFPPETLEEYELRCLQKATEMGILDKVKF